MKNFTILLGILLLMTSCQSLQFSSLRSSYSIDKKLPPLEPEFDTQSFALEYYDLYEIPSAVFSRSSRAVNKAVNNATTEYKIAEDTRRLFDSELIRNISENVGETAGYVVCRRGIRSKGITTYVNPTVSILTLGIANLFGYTYATHRDELEVVIDIYDLNDKIIGSYNAMGYGEAKVRLYKGYSSNDAKRLAHARAFTDSMNNIKDQIMEDQNSLAGLLSLD
ncbi:hypothetical protein N9L92_03965 [Saprospiraceae bacterium]|nr:hypothetical protein [Saprospiraceae bacterium]